MAHKFTSISQGKYTSTIFCEKCGYVSQNANDGSMKTKDGELISMFRLANIPRNCIE